ncbi:glucosaminidase domain-containing protein [Candidatus Gracilibacteria bacterium]|nr:glucosaminidase domain-containing protein [Candidatus Gracilibacteria bacterium]
MPVRLCSYLIFLFFLSVSGFSYARCGDKDYIDKMTEIVEAKKEKIGGLALKIPTSIAVAQAVLETGYGESKLARTKNNHFGLRSKNGYYSFLTVKQGVLFYLENLIEGPYYSKFQNLLKKGEKRESVLLKSIASIYAEDDDYQSKLAFVIKVCRL